jgi:hypothetical protein
VQIDVQHGFLESLDRSRLFCAMPWRQKKAPSLKGLGHQEEA